MAYPPAHIHPYNTKRTAKPAIKPQSVTYERESAYSCCSDSQIRFE